MHIERLPNGNWRAAVSVNGKRRSVTRRTKGEARHAGAELVIELGGNPTASSSTVGELVAGHLAAAANDWSPTTHDDMTRVSKTVDQSPRNVDIGPHKHPLKVAASATLTV